MFFCYAHAFCLSMEEVGKGIEGGGGGDRERVKLTVNGKVEF